MKGVGPPGQAGPPEPVGPPDSRLETLDPMLGPGLGPGPEPPGGPGRLLGPSVCCSPLGPSKGVEAEPGPTEDEEEEEDGMRGPEGGPFEGTGLEWSEPPNGEWYPGRHRQKGRQADDRGCRYSLPVFKKGRLRTNYRV